MPGNQHEVWSFNVTNSRLSTRHSYGNLRARDSSASRSRDLDGDVDLHRRDRGLRAVGVAGVLRSGRGADVGSRPAGFCGRRSWRCRWCPRIWCSRSRWSALSAFSTETLRLAHGAQRRVEAARSRMAAARLVALHDLDPRGARAGRDLLPRLVMWTLYMRWNGARIGRGVHINSLSISDHNMLEFGDGVVIGENVHLSGHTVEGGMVKTGPVKLVAVRDRRPGQHGGHQRRGRREVPDWRDERGAEGHEARRRLRLRRRAGPQDRAQQRRPRSSKPRS